MGIRCYSEGLLQVHQVLGQVRKVISQGGDERKGTVKWANLGLVCYRGHE